MRSIKFLGVICAALVSFTSFAQQKDTIEYRVEPVCNWVFYGEQNPVVEMVLVNNFSNMQKSELTCQISKDTGEKLYDFKQQSFVAPKDSVRVSFSFNTPAPGFYSVVFSADNKQIKKFNIAYEPEKISSPADAQRDFNQFWDLSILQLHEIAPEYKVVRNKELSGKYRTVYDVTMKSFEGETIRAYWAVPKKKKNYPAVITYMGYGATPWTPIVDTPESAKMAELIISVRGQALNQEYNKYGDWFTFGMDKKETYYYRGAYMDVIRAIDFVYSREGVDKSKIFAQGGSQGGAFTLVACALDDRIAAGAPHVPFMSDFVDYEKLGRWIGGAIRQQAKEKSVPVEKVLEVMSYFDIKNFAHKIKCPIVMGVGLQDIVCPPHTNFSGYNLITSPKEYYIYPKNGHSLPIKEWFKVRENFFDKFIEEK